LQIEPNGVLDDQLLALPVATAFSYGKSF